MGKLSESGFTGLRDLQNNRLRGHGQEGSLERVPLGYGVSEQPLTLELCLSQVLLK